MNSAPAPGKPTGQEESNSWGCSGRGTQGASVSQVPVWAAARGGGGGALSPAVAQALQGAFPSHVMRHIGEPWAPKLVPDDWGARAAGFQFWGGGEPG